MFPNLTTRRLGKIFICFIIYLIFICKCKNYLFNGLHAVSWHIDLFSRIFWSIQFNFWHWAQPPREKLIAEQRKEVEYLEYFIKFHNIFLHTFQTWVELKQWWTILTVEIPRMQGYFIGLHHLFQILLLPLFVKTFPLPHIKFNFKSFPPNFVHPLQ